MQSEKICLHDGDLSAISDLMNNGFSFQDAAGIARTKQNQRTMIILEEKLKEGRDGENVIGAYLPAQYAGYFSGFIQYMPLKDALSAILQIVSSERKQKEELIKGILYPCLLFLGVNAGVLLFNSCVLPMMIQMMASFQYDASAVSMIQNILNLFSSIIFLGILIASVMAWYFLRPSQRIKTYHWIAARFPEALIVKCASSQFCRFYLECVKRKVATRESLLILKNLHQKPFVQDIARTLDILLNQGEGITGAVQQAAAESAFVRIFEIAVYASNCEEMMEGYLDMVQKRTEDEIHHFSRIIQCISYAAVAVVIALVYQVLLMPIQMMQTL